MSDMIRIVSISIVGLASLVLMLLRFADAIGEGEFMAMFVILPMVGAIVGFLAGAAEFKEYQEEEEHSEEQSGLPRCTNSGVHRRAA